MGNNLQQTETNDTSIEGNPNQPLPAGIAIPIEEAKRYQKNYLEGRYKLITEGLNLEQDTCSIWFSFEHIRKYMDYIEAKHGTRDKHGLRFHLAAYDDKNGEKGSTCLLCNCDKGAV